MASDKNEGFGNWRRGEHRGRRDSGTDWDLVNGGVRMARWGASVLIGLNKYRQDRQAGAMETNVAGLDDGLV